MSNLVLPNKLQEYLDITKTMDIEIKGDKFGLTPEAEQTIFLIKQAQEFFKEADEILKERLLEIFKKNKSQIKFEGDLITAGYRTRRSKKITGNAESQFYETVKKPILKTIDAYVKATGELPVGIEEKTSEYVDIKLT